MTPYKPNERETKILALLKIKKIMLRKEIREHFGLSNREMNRTSLKLRQANMVVSSATGACNRWYDKEYADSLGIKSTKRVSQGKWSNTDQFEQPYIDRLNLINSLWPKSIAYSA